MTPVSPASSRGDDDIASLGFVFENRLISDAIAAIRFPVSAPFPSCSGDSAGGSGSAFLFHEDRESTMSLTIAFKRTPKGILAASAYAIYKRPYLPKGADVFESLRAHWPARQPHGFRHVDIHAHFGCRSPQTAEFCNAAFAHERHLTSGSSA
jgi:hypothetical protein